MATLVLPTWQKHSILHTASLLLTTSQKKHQCPHGKTSRFHMVNLPTYPRQLLAHHSHHLHTASPPAHPSPKCQMFSFIWFDTWHFFSSATSLSSLMLPSWHFFPSPHGPLMRHNFLWLLHFFPWLLVFSLYL